MESLDTGLQAYGTTVSDIRDENADGADNISGMNVNLQEPDLLEQMMRRDSRTDYKTKAPLQQHSF